MTALFSCWHIYIPSLSPLPLGKGGALKLCDNISDAPNKKAAPKGCLSFFWQWTKSPLEHHR